MVLLLYACHEILELIWTVAVTQMLAVTLLGQYPGKGEISQNVCNVAICLPALSAWW